jgi:hypothetical protein
MPKAPLTEAQIAARARNRLRGRRLAARRDAAERKLRIFARLTAGDSYLAIAKDECCSARRVRAIVAEALEKREIDPLGQFAQLQIARLNDALYVAHTKMIRGDLQGLDRLLRIVDQLDRYAGRYAAAASGGEAQAKIAATEVAAPRALPAPVAQKIDVTAEEGAESNRCATL